MKIEALYNELVHSARMYTNSINREDANDIEIGTSTLTDVVNRFMFMNKGKIENHTIEYRLIKELRKFSKAMFVKTTNPTVYKTNVQRNIDFLTWINRQIKTNKGGRKYTVAQREVFFADLGYNIGSEQNGSRPVVILQNNIGNTKGNTTIVAPVTTHQKKIRRDSGTNKYYVEIEKNGIYTRKYLDFYEIPLELEGKAGLYGFVNVMHIREIDRKRINNGCVGVATVECFEKIQKAILKNLS